MKIIIDRYIPFIEGILEPYGEVVYATPDEITPSLVSDADALLIRTRTKVDRKLLGDNPRCRFVATATIGADHIDREFCSKAGINAYSAAGCNAPAVAQYVYAAIMQLIPQEEIAEKTLAIVGVGNIGKIVERWAKSLGMNVLLVDPPRAENEPDKHWSTLGDVAREADIITFHTPLARAGRYATYHLADKAFFDSLERRPILINASRGGVVDNTAWLDAIREGKLSASVADVWEGEPFINTKLMDAVDIATPHIAGYSLNGKIRATNQVLEALCSHFGLPRLKADAPEPSAVPETVTFEDIRKSYSIMDDDQYMRSRMESATEGERAELFERLRDVYELRKEV